MAAGSSAPELAVVIVSLIKSGNHQAIGIGTIVGSALFNLFIIIGAVMVIKSNRKMVWQPLVRDLIFYAFSIILLVWFFNDGSFSLWEAAIFVMGYLLYLGIMFLWNKQYPYDDTETNSEVDESMSLNRFDMMLKRIIPRANNMFIALVLDIIVIGVLSWVLVTSAIKISSILGIPEVVIALTVIALGTSVPDLIASVIVAKQGRPGMAINNAIGSNIFDILIGLGLPFLFLFIFSNNSYLNVNNSNLFVSFLLLIGSVGIIIIGLLLSKWKTKQQMGWFLIFLYIIYLCYQIAGVI